MTTFTIKLIAVIAMTLDHSYMIIGQGGLLALFPELSLQASAMIIGPLANVSRIAFPLFAFMIAEGAARTRSMPKYIGRLALFAVLSEPVFYFALSRMEPSWEGLVNNLARFRFTNVLFTLMLGAFLIFAYQKMETWMVRRRWLLFGPVFALGLFLAEFAHCNYGAAGVLLIVALYLLKTKRQKILAIGLWSVGLYIVGQAGWLLNWNQVSWDSVMNCIFAALAGVPVWYYNGRRGRPWKWSFYVYYPAHLLALHCVSNLIR